MISVIPSLLKLSDYPFSYSIVGILLLSNGQSVDLTNIAHSGPLFLIMGTIGTALSIIDPVGALIRTIERLRPRRSEQELLSIVKPDVSISLETRRNSLTSKALKSKWITYEVDKIVSSVYFLFVIFGILFLLVSANFALAICSLLSPNSIPIATDKTRPQPTCSYYDNVKGIAMALTILAAAGILLGVIFAVLRLRGNMYVIMTYFLGISLIPRAKIGNQELAKELGTYCDQIVHYASEKDWAMAEAYAHNTRNFIKNFNRL